MSMPKTALSLEGAIFVAAIASALVFSLLFALGLYNNSVKFLSLSFIALAVVPVFIRFRIPKVLMIFAAALIPPLYLVDERLQAVASVLVGLLAAAGWENR